MFLVWLAIDDLKLLDSTLYFERLELQTVLDDQGDSVMLFIFLAW